MEKEIEKMSGYDLARRVLEHEHGGVEALLSLSGNDESLWLELKAGMALLPDDEKKGETQLNVYLFQGKNMIDDKLEKNDVSSNQPLIPFNYK